MDRHLQIPLFEIGDSVDHDILLLRHFSGGCDDLQDICFGVHGVVSYRARDHRGPAWCYEQECSSGSPPC
jgi:hypothetical protein